MPIESACTMDPTVEVIHGEKVIDPYRWLEDRSIRETESWIQDQQTLCEEYFATCSELQTIRNRVRSYLDVEVIDQPSRMVGLYFFRRRSRGEEQSRIYVRDIATGRERLLVDPSSGGPFTSVSIYGISNDGSILAYERKRGGEDRSEVGFVGIREKQVFGESLESGYLRGLVLRPEEAGFYYCHESDESIGDHTLSFRHFREKGGGRVVFRKPRTLGSRLLVTADNGRLGVMWLHEGLSGIVSDFFIAELGSRPHWVRVFSDRDPSFHPFLHQGRIFARCGSGDVSEFSSDGHKIRTVVPGDTVPIGKIALTNGRIYSSHLDYHGSHISCWSLDGESLGQIATPTDGTITLLPSRSESEHNIFYSYESFNQPTMIFEYHCATGKSKVWHRPISEGQQIHCTVSRHAFTGKDGTQVPITVVEPPHALKCTPISAILTAYGGFGVSMSPHFSVLATIMMEFGTTFAIAHVRGGGEFGRQWHEAGSKRNRQQGIDDLIAAAEWLRSSGFAASQQLATFGGSNSGLILAAALTQRPDLFGAALCIAPLLDMVRYEYFDLAARWRAEYGTVEDPDDFRALFSYSPYHRIGVNTNYPPTMFVVGDKDDRCNPAHVRKMAARLQNRANQTSPVIVDYSVERGHVPALPLSVRIEALTRRIAFLTRELNILKSAGGHNEALCD